MKTFFKVLLYILPMAAAITWTIEPAFRTMLATLQFEPMQLQASHFESAESNTELKRKMQKHFLNYKVYIPMEDIVTLGPNSNEQMMKTIMARSCGQANVYVWTPLGFRLPFLGLKFIDRCWKPEVILE